VARAADRTLERYCAILKMDNLLTPKTRRSRGGTPARRGKGNMSWV